MESFLPEVNDFNEIREKNIQLEEISENTEIDEESLYVDSDNEIEDEDIKRCIQLMYASEIFMFGLYAFFIFREYLFGF